MVPGRQRRGACAFAVAVGLAVLAAGCGSEDNYANKPRPPKPINVTAAVTAERVSLSPRTFGAGPIVLIVSNQTDESQQVTIETDELGGDQGGITQTSGPINPDGTATLKVDVREGDYLVSVEDGGIRPANLKVGAMRPSAQNDLLQP